MLLSTTGKRHTMEVDQQLFRIGTSNPMRSRSILKNFAIRLHAPFLANSKIRIISGWADITAALSVLKFHKST
jgi:hypothetical protein